MAVVEAMAPETAEAERWLDPGGWLVSHRWEMDRGESSLLEALAAFDREQRWADDGQLSCLEWLMWRTDMARATAFEKLRIAHQLHARPTIAGAFADGQLSYSAVRAITRIDDPDPYVDATLINVAVAGTVADVERAVRVYQLHPDQHRYLVHVITHPGEQTTLADGSPLDPVTAEVVACDASAVVHVVGADGEPLAQGRKTRVWSTSQRRAAMLRGGGHCRFPGCHRRVADLHHHQPWSHGGPTDIDNGYLACARHHTLLHAGFTATGNPNGPLTFHRPDGTPIGTTTPAMAVAGSSRGRGGAAPAR